MAQSSCSCFDRILPRELLREGVPRHGLAGRVRAISPISKLWMNGATLRVRFIGGTTEQHRIARQQASWWSDCANLRFSFDADGDAEIRVAFDADNGNWSYIGTDARLVPASEPTMNLATIDAGIPAHQFGHAIGLQHEWSADTDWDDAAVIAALAGPPNHWTPDQTRRHFLDRYRLTQINGTAPDPESIMTLFFPGTWTRSGVGEPPRRGLSELDTALVRRRMYPKPICEVLPATPLQVNAARRTQAPIAADDEGRCFSFDIATPGRHVVDAQGCAGLQMTLFGPDSPAIPLANGSPAPRGAVRIEEDLQPGTYWALVRAPRRDVEHRITVRVRPARQRAGG